MSSPATLADATALLTKWAAVDVSAIRQNTAAVLAAMGDGVEMMAMVKAGGYGHGGALAARAALEGGATWLGVSSAEEALALRAEGFTAPILVAGWSPPGRLAALVAAGVHLTAWEPDQVVAAAQVGTRQTPALLHLKVDTGMGRLGCRPEALPALGDAVRRGGARVRPVGTFTHFADAEGDIEHTRLQEHRFREAVESLRRRWPDLVLHAANSAAALRLPETRHDLVRCGIALYGYPPAGAGPGLRPAMTVTARVTMVKTVRPGESVGYGRTWVARRPTRVATVAAGYADGIHRAHSNRGAVLIGGRRCPIIGTVSMDQHTADVSEAGEVRPGDEAVLVGRQGGAWLGADDVARAVGTISYEVLCSVSSRVPRLRTG